jgi:DNA-binding NtrC family response regulator
MERREDIPILIRYFMNKYCAAFSKRVTRIDPQAEKILQDYTYPGNVRELENIIERAVALTESDSISVDDLPPDLHEYSVETFGKWPTLEERERDYLRKVLDYTDHNMGQAGRILDIPRTTLWRKIKKYGLSHTSE